MFGLVCSWTGFQQSPRAFIVDELKPQNYCPSIHAYSDDCIIIQKLNWSVISVLKIPLNMTNL